MAYTRAAIAATTHRALGALAADAGLSTEADEEQTEGSYTDAIDAGLRAIGALNPDTGDMDMSLVTSVNIDLLLRFVKASMLDLLELHYATLTDISVGDREEKLSQVGAAIARLLSTSRPGGAGGQVQTRPLRREANDYELG